MKKVIKNLLYDTETATLIVSETGEDGKTLVKRLYMTQNRAFFFLIIASNDIQPISEEECREWLGLFNYQAYVNVFGEPQKA